MPLTKKNIKRQVEHKRKQSTSAALKRSQKSVKMLQDKLNAIENNGATLHLTNREIEYIKEIVYVEMALHAENLKSIDDEWKSGLIINYIKEKSEFAEKLYRKLCFDV